MRHKLTTLIAVIAAAIASLALGSCHSTGEYADNPSGNFEALWTILDQHYCFFAEKDVDWNKVHDTYKAKIRGFMTDEELFRVCAEMLDELRDGHTNLSAPFETSYYRRWWTDYPENFSLRLIQESYFNFNYRQTGSIIYGVLPQNVGYMYYPSFASPVGNGNLDWILYYLSTCQGLIIDIRNNGGGNMDNVETLFSRFITERTLIGSICHKSGPGHDDFSEPFDYYCDPAPVGRIMWGKPVIVLTNRSTFSAANNFASVMRLLPNCRLVGARTGGGSGMPFSSELPNGWSVRFSGSPVRDAQGQLTEFGIEPSEGCAVDMNPEDALAGKDTILEFAISLLSTN